ncbi:hypothetical protein OAT67_01790 [Bacteriovoracaceae bacterium]|nr:hypothetical protein [Bacteriovoracaceae bacterium]
MEELVMKTLTECFSVAENSAFSLKENSLNLKRNQQRGKVLESTHCIEKVLSLEAI